MKSGRAKQIRVDAGLSQAELGADVGVTYQAISRWEANERVPHGEVAVRYLQVLRQLERALEVPAG